MIFKTLNSTYEIDDDAPRVRRIIGKNEPLIGPDGEWREFTDAGAWGGRMTFALTDGNMLVTSSVVDWDGPGNLFDLERDVTDSSD